MQIQELFDFHLTGLVTNIKDYQLAWYLNKELKVRFSKTPDSRLIIKGVTFSFSSFATTSEWGEIKIIKNRSYASSNQTAYILPELNTFDYLLSLSPASNSNDYDQFVGLLGHINVIQFVKPLDINRVKSKENLIL